MKFILSFFLCAFFLLNSFSQEKLDLDLSNSCSFNGAPIKGEIYGFASSNEAIQIIDEIVGHIGLKRNFKIKAGNVPNAAATIKPGNNGEYDRYILYSQSFMSNIINETNSYWSAIGIMAHEVAHHLNGHTLKGPSRPPTELEADEFAGFVLYKMGATLEQAQSMFNNKTMFTPYKSETHPATPARLEAVAVGYQKSKEKSGNITTSKLPKNRNRQNTQTNYPPQNSTSKEHLKSNQVQYITANINGQNTEFQILKDKRLLMVTSRTIAANGDNNVNVTPAGSFILYNNGSQNYYAVTVGFMNPTNRATTNYTFTINNNKDIYVNQTNSAWQPIGKLKFDWGLINRSGTVNTKPTREELERFVKKQEELERVKKNQSNGYYKIKFENKCHEKISILLRYKNLSGEWISNGWWTMNPGEKIYMVDTKNSIFYYYAKSTSGMSWSGDKVRSFKGSNYSFKKVEINKSNYGTYNHSLSCDN